MITYIVGTILLVHAAYSSHEFHQVTGSGNMPYDIIVEVVVGLFILAIAATLSVKNARVYSLKDESVVVPEEKFLKPIRMDRAMNEFHKIGISDYEEFDNRVDFLDITKKRKEHHEWMNEKS